MSNNSKYYVGGGVAALAVISIFLFGFTVQRAGEAYEMGVQNRERIAVMESKLDNMAETLNEVRRDVKTLVRIYPE